MPSESTGLEVQKHSVHTLVFRSLKRTHDLFLSDRSVLPAVDEKSEKIKIACKVHDEYGLVKTVGNNKPPEHQVSHSKNEVHEPLDWSDSGSQQTVEASQQLALARIEQPSHASASERFTPAGTNKALVTIGDQKMLVPRKAQTMPKPIWHPPWKLMRVISGHNGWVRCVAVEPGNEWFATGSADRIVKIWDLATGTLKLSLTGHVSTVRGVAVSPRHPYLFSCGEDKQVKCWDLECNKVIRHYHGHLSAVYALDIHPTIDILATCGRDATVRIWDMRSKCQVHALTGHTNTVATVKCQAVEPQVISGGHDSTIRLWDIVAAKTHATLTNHKKSVRSIVLHPTQYAMASGSPDNIKQWKLPDGMFLQNLSGHNTIVNALAVNQDGVLVSGGDNGSMFFWDWKSGYNFQRHQAQAQPGSIDSEAGIFAMTFDNSGSRLITCETDKTIKIYKEDDSASEETHPIHWRPDILKKPRY